VRNGIGVLNAEGSGFRVCEFFASLELTSSALCRGPASSSSAQVVMSVAPVVAVSLSVSEMPDTSASCVCVSSR